MASNIGKDHSDSERGNLMLPHGLFFPISSKGSFICIIPDSIAHATVFVTPVVEYWQEQENSSVGLPQLTYCTVWSSNT